MARCGCGGGTCTCKFEAGTGIRITGLGTRTSRLVISAEPLVLQVQDSDTVDLSLDGLGTDADPLVISAEITETGLEDKWDRWVGTQAEYDALGTYDDGTLYAIRGS